MLTYRLVQPSFVLLKLADLFGVNRLQVSVSSGKLEPKDPSLLLRIWHIVLVVKIVQLLISLVRVLYYSNFNSKFIERTLLLSMVTCLAAVGLNWSLAMNQNICDLIIILRPLQNLEHSGVSGSRSKRSEAFEKINQKSFCTKQIDKLVNLCRHVLKYIKAFYADFSHLRPTFTIHDVLTIGVPFAICSLLPVACFCIVIGEPHDLFFQSLLPPDWQALKAVRIAMGFFDLTAVSFGALTFQWGFFSLCAILAVYTRELQNLDKIIR